MPQSITTTTTTTQTTFSTQAPADSGTQIPQPIIVPKAVYEAAPDVMPPPAVAPLAAPPAMAPGNVHPPGQTVDDLLMSILGATPLPPAPPMPSIARAPVLPQTAPPPIPEATKPGQELRSPVAQPPIHSKLTDATFAPGGSAAVNGVHHSPISTRRGPNHAASPLPSGPQLQSGQAASPSISPQPNGRPPIAAPPGMTDALADGLAARYGNTLASEEKAAQGRFIQHILELIHVGLSTSRPRSRVVS
jgi:hypothetical protein